MVILKCELLLKVDVGWVSQFPKLWSLPNFIRLWLLEHFVPEKLVVTCKNQLNCQ